MLRSLLRLVPLLLVGLPALAQAPLVTKAAESLHQQWLAQAATRAEEPIAPDGVAVSVGLLSVSRDSSTPWMPLIHGVGLGTVTVGQGVMVQGEWFHQGWEISANVTGLRNREDASTRARLQEFRLVKRTPSGWRWGLEKKPLQWGYGLFGGYLLGDSHDSVPKLVLESPLREIRIFGVPLGAWGFDTFLGRLEWDRQVPPWISNPQTTRRALDAQGDLRRPNLSGLRLRAAFGERVDMTFGVVSKWGGVDYSGRDIMKGLPLWNYPLGYLGIENVAVAEAAGNPTSDNYDPNNPTPTPSDYKNISNALADVEIRVRVPETSPLRFGAKGMFLYLSRGATSANWKWKDFLKKPFSAWSHDLRYVTGELNKFALKGTGPSDLWGYSYAQGTPSLAHINDTVGIQWVFDRWDLGIEVSDTHNQPYPGSTFRVYGNGRVLAGHSHFGDSLGQPLGGEIYHQGFSLGLELPAQGHMQLQVLDAIRFFRDSPETISPFIPGADDHFIHVQMDAQWLLAPGRIGGSLALERHQADQFVPGNRRSNWILSLGYAVPILKH